MTNKRKLYRKEILAMFKADILPHIKEQYEQNGKVDHIARREAFNNYTDMLYKEGLIKEKDYEEYNPY